MSRFACGSSAGFQGYNGEQVLKDLAKQFRVKRNFFLNRRVLFNGELVNC